MKETQQKQPPKHPKATFASVYCVILIIVLLMNTLLFPAMARMSIRSVDYGTFLNMLEEEKLTTVQLEEQVIYFVDKDGASYKTNAIPQDLQIVDRLINAGVKFDRVYDCLLYTSPSPRDRG